MTKQIKLTLTDELFDKIDKEKKVFGYLSVQEVVNEVLRDKFFRIRGISGNKAGRPKKFDESRAITRHGNIFSRKGKAISV